MAKPRSRFEIHAVFPDGYHMAFVSRKDKPLSIPKLVESLRAYAEIIETAHAAEVVETALEVAEQRGIL